VLTAHVIRDLVSVDDDSLDRVFRGNVAGGQRQLDLIADLVKPATKRASSRGRQHDWLYETAETAGVA